MYAISRFSKDPSRVRLGLQNEIDEFLKIQCQLNDAAGTPNMNFLLEGNHERRWEKFFWDKPELYGLRALTIEKVLELEALGLKLKDEIIIGKTEFRHGDFATQYSAKKHLENNGYQRSLFIGHVHKLGSWFKTTANDMVMAITCGGLMDIDAADFVQGRAEWQNGLVLIDIHRNRCFPTIIPFHGRNRYMWAYFNDKEYKA